MKKAQTKADLQREIRRLLRRWRRMRLWVGLHVSTRDFPALVDELERLERRK
jgi:hypothetical protein